MNQPESCNPRRKLIRGAARITACVTALLAVACIASYLADSAKLQRIARQATQGTTHNTEKVIALMNWVHDNKGFHENENYFVFKKMRATPLQVLKSGGDCADKSRLLCALLREAGIRSTMAMCFHRDTRAATHTVVEAQTGKGQFMVVDPVYGLYFPKEEKGDFYDLLELRNDPHILDRRIAQLLATAPRISPLHLYNPRSAAYDHACSIHWNKNAATRAARSFLSSWYGDEVYRLRRPLLLEEPKLFLSAVLLLVAASLAVAARIVGTLPVSPFTSPTIAGAASCGR